MAALVEQTVRARLADPATAAALAHALAAIDSAAPFAAEPDRERRIRRIEALSGAPREIAEAVADTGNTGLPRAAIEEARRSAEARARGTIPTRLLGAGVAAVTAVARLRPPGRTGTALLLSHNLLLTTAGLLPDPACAAATRVDIDALAPSAPKAHLAPERLFHCEADPDLDFSLVAVDLPPGATSLIRPCRLGESPDRHAIGEPLVLVQYPPGRPPELLFRGTRALHRLGNALLYAGDPAPGCEGAPIFNDDWELVAIHHWRGDTPDPAGQPAPRINEAIRASAIAARLRTLLAHLAPGASSIVGEALGDPARI